MTGKLPQNIFDTQIAAEVCGFGENVSYGNLVKEITSVELDKSCRLTDWSLRPLDEKQLEYALHDVTYLVDCYKFLLQHMQEHNRSEWIKEEMEEAYSLKNYVMDPEEAWHKVRHNIHSKHFLSALKYLALWREKRAQKFNIPRQSVLKDEILINLASSRPMNLKDLKTVRNLKSDIANGKIGEEILNVIEYAAHNPLNDEECALDKQSDIAVSGRHQSLLEMLRFLLKLQCMDNDVVCHIVASEEELRRFVRGESDKVLFMHGWRYEIFGQFAEKLKNGELSISYNPTDRKIEVR